jgi:hypothetical protein
MDSRLSQSDFGGRILEKTASEDNFYLCLIGAKKHNSLWPQTAVSRICWAQRSMRLTTYKCATWCENQARLPA